MAKIIKKHWDIILLFVIGILLGVSAILGLRGTGPLVNYASAATTATVTVTATVAQNAELTVSAVNVGQSINAATTTVTTTATTVPLGTLSTATNTVAAHTLTMTTNAGGGYTVTAQYDHKLYRTSSTTQDIDDHTGTNASPAVFSGAGTEAFGYTTEDFSLGTGTANRFSGGKWAKFETTAYEVAYHSGPVNATTTKIGYQAGISGLTAAGTDYTCIVTYTMSASF